MTQPFRSVVRVWALILVPSTLVLQARCGAAHAHAGGPLPPWQPDLLLLPLLAFGAVAYGAGHRRRAARAQAGRVPHRRQAIAFGLCQASLLLALVSPLDGLADLSFAAHMIQHELLMVLAAPLLVLARPLDTYLWLLPGSYRRRFWVGPAGSTLMALIDRATRPLVAFAVHFVVRWIWHLPLLFEAALRWPWLHALQHAGFFFSAVCFWWGIVYGRYGRAGYGAAALFVMLTALHTGGLGALLAFGEHAWYPLQFGLDPQLAFDAVEDQQLAGVIMWVGAGMWLMLLALALFLAWLGEAELRGARTALAAASQPPRGERP